MSATESGGVEVCKYVLKWLIFACKSPKYADTGGGAKIDKF